jgi:N-methylhydantoinase A
LRVVYELRYRGQAFELAIPGSPAAEPDQLREAFEAEHEERYGYRDPEQELELVTVRVSAIVPGGTVSIGGAGDGTLSRSRRRATLAGREVEFEVLRGEPKAGTSIAGPAVVELPEATLLVPPGWSGEVDPTGTIKLVSSR